MRNAAETGSFTFGGASIGDVSDVPDPRPHPYLPTVRRWGSLGFLIAVVTLVVAVFADVDVLVIPAAVSGALWATVAGSLNLLRPATVHRAALDEDGVDVDPPDDRRLAVVRTAGVIYLILAVSLVAGAILWSVTG